MTWLSFENVQFFLVVFVRVTAMISLLPVLGSQNIPVHVKVILSFVLAIIIFPMVPIPSTRLDQFSTVHFFVMIIKEVFVGLLIGFASTFLFAAVQFAGRLIDTQMGFALVQLIDPFTDARVSTMGQFKTLVFTIFFLLINGHFFLILAIQKSFEVIPLLGVSMPGGKIAFLLVSMAGNVFVAALKLSAPVFIALVLTSITMGIVARTVPQVNVFFVGLPLKIGVGLVSMIVALPMLTTVFKKMFDALMQDLWKLLYLMA
ncbi:MAG: flagellar type III secretion system protein FliR [Chitinivibrionales bacterium]|nr:flagellar type III secretion system protein FliR [Chitinivibrionales bacterium]